MCEPLDPPVTHDTEVEVLRSALERIANWFGVESTDRLRFGDAAIFARHELTRAKWAREAEDARTNTRTD